MDDERLVKTRIEQIESLTGRQLVDDDRDLVQGNLSRYIEIERTMRDWELKNSDEPDFVFKVYQEED